MESLHDLRKAFCAYWTEHGRTIHTIAAMSGHRWLYEIELYMCAVDRRRMVEALRSMSRPSNRCSCNAPALG
jgi:site-specific recombinase XerD